MIEIEKSESKLLLKYYFSDYFPNDWIEKALKEKDEITLSGVFHVNKSLLVKKKEGELDLPDYYFLIGELEEDYYRIDKEVFGIENPFFFHDSIDLSTDHFVAPSKISILAQIDQHVDQEIYIGGNLENVLPIEEYQRILDSFPGTYEVNLYRQAKVTSIIKNYFDNVPDKESQYKKYINKKTPVRKSHLRASFKESELIKYRVLLEKLKTMLDSENTYSEHQWQEEILQIILLLFPKYLAAFPEVRFKDVDNNKTRRLDFGLVDYNGHLDMVEIKIPFDKNIVSKSQYRDNHIPNRDLSGTIMQIEKYIYYLNKSAHSEEKKFTEKYKDQLPEGMNIKIINPLGIVLLGRDIQMDDAQMRDFEIIKRKYKHVIDILTYDDLIRRLERIVENLEKMESF